MVGAGPLLACVHVEKAEAVDDGHCVEKTVALDVCD
jgi:hypothetical protein